MRRQAALDESRVADKKIEGSVEKRHNFYRRTESRVDRIGIYKYRRQKREREARRADKRDKGARGPVRDTLLRKHGLAVSFIALY